MSLWQRLSLTGDGPACLHAPGLSQALFSDGERLGWADAGGLYASDGDAVGFLALPGVVALVVSPTRWVAQTDDGLLHWGSPLGEDWQSRDLPPGEVFFGQQWLVWRRGLESGLQTLDGEGLKLPHTASKAKPLPDGAGLFWISAGTLYRMDSAGKIQALDAVPSPVGAWHVGPGGSVLIEAGDRVYASVGGRMLVPLDDSALLKDVCFHHSGEQALMRTEAGCGLYDLLTGEHQGTYAEVAPVCLSPQTVVLEEETGELLTPDGDLIFGGFLGGPALLSGNLLLGPGAAAWDLETGAQPYAGPPLAAEELLASSDTIYCIHDEEVALLDRETGAELKWLERPDGVPMMADDTLLFVEDVQQDEDDGEAPEPIDGAAGLPVTSAATAGGRRWAWNDDGLLVSFSAGQAAGDGDVGEE